MNAQIFVAPYELLLEQKRGKMWKYFGDSKRGRLEIIAEILLFCSGARKAKTKIMFATNLSYPLLQKYSEMLTTRGLLGLENGKYVTTDKGFAFLDLFAGIYDILTDRGV